MEKEHHGFLYGLIAAISSAGMAVFAKLGADTPVETMVFARFALGIPLLWWVIVHKKIRISWKQIPKHLLRALGGLIALYLYFYSVKMIPLVNAVTLTNTAPLFMPFVVLFWLKLLVSKRRFLAVGIGFVGVFILLRPTSSILGWGSLVGVGAGLFAAISLMGVRQLSRTESTETILSYYFLIGSIVSFFPMLITWEPITTSINWIFLVLIALFALIYQYTITKAYTHAPATKVSTLNYLSVAFSGLTGWWIFGEVPSYWVLLGTALIIAGAILAILDKTPAKPLGSK